MIKVKFIPKTNIEEYLNSNWNVSRYNELVESNINRQKLKMPVLFEPLDFFNLLYEQFEIVKTNKAEPIAVANHLFALKLLKDHNWIFFTQWLMALIRREGNKNNDEQLKICCRFMWDASEEEFNKRNKNKNIKKAKIEKVWDFDREKKHIETLRNDKDKIVYIIEQLTKLSQRNVEMGFEDEYLKEHAPAWIAFQGQMKLEIEKLREIGNVVTKTSNRIGEVNSELSVPEIALKQFFIFRYEGGTEIFKGNAKQFLEGTPYKHTAKLINCFAQYKKDINRIGFNSKNGRTDTKLLREQIKRYENILSKLKDSYPKAHHAAEKEYNTLKQA